MTTHLFALGNRPRSTAAVQVLAVAAALIMAPTAARAANGHPMSVLADGAGMGAKPSDRVRHVQRALYQRGYNLGAPGVDGRFGPLTAAAVRRLQADSGLAVDGVVGDHTRKALRSPRLADRNAQSRTHDNNRAHGARDPRPSAPERSTAPVTTGRPASRSLAQPSKNRLGPVTTGATLATFVTAPFILLLGFVRRRRHRAGSAERCLRAALATAVTEAAQLEQASDRTVRLVDQVDTAAPVSVGAAEARLSAGTIATKRARSGRNLREIGEPPREQTLHLVDQTDAAAPASVGATDVQRSPSYVSAGQCVIGYVTVSAEPGSDLADASLVAIEAACERSGWKLLEVVRDRENGRILERPGLHYALERIANGKARALVVGELHRLSRSIVDLGALMAWFRDSQATLLALDLGIDTSTPEGYHVATTLIALSDWEHERIANRTRSGLADVRAHGHPTGRPAVSDRPELLQRIWAMRAANMTLQAIANQLNDEQIPTLRGGSKWRPSSIQAALGYRRPGPRDHLPSPRKRGALSPQRSTTLAPAPAAAAAAAASRTQPGRRGNANNPDSPASER